MKQALILLGAYLMCSCTLTFNEIEAQGNVYEFMDQTLKTDSKIDANLHIPSL
jgi:hypothetical protein